jgi:hypothetical protein
VIFAAIAIAWLAYLVPHFVRKRGDEPDEAADPINRFSDSVRIVKHGTAPLLDQDLEPISTYEVSTPLTRRAAIADLRRLEQVAARRRRRVLVVLLALLSVAVGLSAAGLLSWWVVAAPGGLLLTFVLLARISVRAMHRQLDKRLNAIAAGGSEQTVFLRLGVDTGASGDSVGASEQSGSSGSHAVSGTLWDPLPITTPTYVSKPLAPRTVRTIDLSGPGATSATRSSVPVTADAQPAVAPEHQDGGRDEREAASA